MILDSQPDNHCIPARTVFLQSLLPTRNDFENLSEVFNQSFNKSFNNIREWAEGIVEGKELVLVSVEGGKGGKGLDVLVGGVF